MRSTSLTLALLLIYLSSCSQNSENNHSSVGKTPLEPKRWYVLNYTTGDVGKLFDGKTNEQVTLGDNNLLRDYEVRYSLEDGEEMTIDSVEMYDGQGTNENEPTTIFAITGNWEKIPIAVFTGMRYNKWNGPDPRSPDKYALTKPVSNVRSLVIQTSGSLPTEIELYGKYTPPKTVTKKVKKHFPLKYYFGVNTYEWDFEDGKNATQLEPARLAMMKNFTSIRHYMDWEKLELSEGKYTFNPTRSGGWNYDTIYKWCRDNNIEVLPCLKTIPKWMQESYPEQQRDNENIPMKYGKNPDDPKSYIEQAKVAFQFAARYGSNKVLPRELVSVDTSKRWHGDDGNKIKIGLGLVRYIECDNERDKWWKGRKAYQTGREYAANLSAFYDGHKGALGKNSGVKNADSSLKVVMAGLADPTTDYLRGMIDWCKEFRGYKYTIQSGLRDSIIDLPFDVINYHYYPNNGNNTKEPTAGIAPELSQAEAIARDFLDVAYLNANDLPVWVTETGYDINEGSPQKAVAIGGRSVLETQGDWTLRNSLLYARAGIEKLFIYQLYDDAPGKGGRFATSGLANSYTSRRPAADFILQTNKLFGDYTFIETISKNPIVDRYAFNGKDMFVAINTDGNKNVVACTINIAANEADIYLPIAGRDDMKKTTQKTNNGKVTITLGQTPVFVVER